MKFLLGSLLLMLALSCQTTKKQGEIAPRPPAPPFHLQIYPLQPDREPLKASVAEREREAREKQKADRPGSFPSKILLSEPFCVPHSTSPSGRWLSLSCQPMARHAHQEVYVYDLRAERLSRVTHHDQPALEPVFLSEDQLLFASATDEIKEDIEGLMMDLSQRYGQGSSTPPSSASEKVSSTAKKNLDQEGPLRWRFLPTEIYSVTRSGSPVQRITRRPGYDGQPSYDRNKKQVYLVAPAAKKVGSAESHLTSLFRMNLKGRQRKALVTEEGYHGNPRVHVESGRVLWFSLATRESEKTSFKISDFRGKKPRTLELESGFHWMPTWHPSGQWIVFSSDQRSSKHFDLYVVRDDGRCLQRLTESAGFDLSPVFSPGGDRLFFARWRTDGVELRELNFTPPESCTAARESIN